MTPGQLLDLCRQLAISSTCSSADYAHQAHILRDHFAWTNAEIARAFLIAHRRGLTPFAVTRAVSALATTKGRSDDMSNKQGAIFETSQAHQAATAGTLRTAYPSSHDATHDPPAASAVNQVATASPFADDASAAVWWKREARAWREWAVGLTGARPETKDTTLRDRVVEMAKARGDDAYRTADGKDGIAGGVPFDAVRRHVDLLRTHERTNAGHAEAAEGSHRPDQARRYTVASAAFKMAADALDQLAADYADDQADEDTPDSLDELVQLPTEEITALIRQAAIVLSERGVLPLDASDRSVEPVTAGHVIAAAVAGAGCLGRAAGDEPVFVLRAQDQFGPCAVEQWAAIVASGGATPAKVAGANRVADAMRAWQQAHGSKVPGLALLAPGAGPRAESATVSCDMAAFKMAGAAQTTEDHEARIKLAREGARLRFARFVWLGLADARRRSDWTNDLAGMERIILAEFERIEAEGGVWP